MKNSTTEGHGYSVKVACEVGVNCAVVIQHLMFLQKSNAKKNEHWQETWVRRSAKTVTETYPYWSIKQIRLTLDTLEKGGYIFSKVENDYVTDRTKSYILSHAGLTLLGIEIEIPEVPKRKMEVPDKEHEQVPKRADANGFSSFTQNGFNVIDSPAADAPDTDPTVLVIETVVVEDEKNGTASMGRGPQTKSWTRIAAEVFDEVAAEKSRQNHIDYQPFNWDVCQEENFRQLKMLRDKAIIPDFKKKFNKEPTDEQMTNSFRAVFRLAWDYFYKIQKDTGGALHYTPTSVYKSYNNIKTTAQNGNINGTTTINGAGANRFGQGVDHNGTFDPKRGY